MENNAELKIIHPVGTARIKAEFLVQDHVRELNLNFVAEKDQKTVSRANEQKASDEPPKKKLKGQNKHRPRQKRTPRSEKLCFKIGVEGSCPFGDSCCYSHNVSEYLDNKPPDLGLSCYLYSTFGKCPYSFSCRFASNHIKEGKNLVDEKWEKYKDKKLYSNVLCKNLQKSLRRRDYDFMKSDEVSKNFFSAFNDKVNEQNGVSKSSNVSNSTKTETLKICDRAGEDKTDKQDKVSDTSGNCFCEADSISLQRLDEEKFKSESFANNTDTNVSVVIEEPKARNIMTEDISPLVPEIKKVDFQDKLYLAPLTTVGNLPFRRICKEFGADITCSEMAVALSLLQGQQSEWALLRRHHTEDVFGIQLCGSHPDVMTRCSQMLSEATSFDFIDLNLGCPLDAIYKKGAGSGLMNRMKKLEGIIYGVSSVIDVPLTLKMRTGIYGSDNIAHNVIKKIQRWKNCVSLITLHGRSREQRYTKSADWDYIKFCNEVAHPIPLFGNGDILSYEDYTLHKTKSGVSGAMIARGALIKPWIFKEIKEQTHWDISSSERLEALRNYTNYGLEHWGSDTEGVEKTRRFLLEWLSFLYRYIPVGLLEYPPQHINERPPKYCGRNELETLMASPSCRDWVKISEMLLGPVPENFIFLPKHKANAYN